MACLGHAEQPGRVGQQSTATGVGHRCTCVPLTACLPCTPACSSGGSVALYPGPFKPGSPALQLQPSGIDGSARLCLSLAASGDAAIAAGSAQGGVAVWDAPTRRLVEEYPSHHSSGRVNAVSFVPLRPDWLYSAGDDGIVCLQVRRPGESVVVLLAAVPLGWRQPRRSAAARSAPLAPPARPPAHACLPGPRVLWPAAACRTASLGGGM